MLKKYKPGDWVTIKGKNFSPKMEVLKYVPKKDGIFGVVNTDTYLECIWYENG